MSAPTLYVMQVAGRTLQLGLGLGFVLAAVLAIGGGRLPRLFTGDAAVLAAIGHIFPWVILSQPINALAFVWDGILYGAGGFSYAAKVSIITSHPFRIDISTNWYADGQSTGSRHCILQCET